MYQFDISRECLAKEAGISTAYLNMIFADTRDPADAEANLTAALDRLVASKTENSVAR